MGKRFFRKLKQAIEEIVAHQRGELELYGETFTAPNRELKVDTKKRSRKRPKNTTPATRSE